MPGRLAHPEQHLQREIVAALRAILLPPALVVAYPAGGGGVLRGAILNGMGLQKGMPDLLLFSGRAYGLEVKTRTGKLSPAQRDTLAALEQAGVDCAVVRSVDKALSMVLLWGIPNRIAANDRERLSRIGSSIA